MSSRWAKKWSCTAPFYFKRSGLGANLTNVVFDARGRYICGQVPNDIGALFAASPTMYATLSHVLSTLTADDPRAELIKRALARADDVEGVDILPPPPAED